ncbi:nucleoside-diphosphate kinase [Candidatus Zixiibacteriota bacterium]
MERTLFIIKPDAVAKRVTDKILQRVTDAGFRLCALKSERLTTETAGNFYHVHRDKPFYESLVEFMSSGPILVAVLEKEEAIKGLREVVGATDPQEAQEGTIRKDFAESKGRNAVHASDSPESAREEIAFFFPAIEFCCD